VSDDLVALLRENIERYTAERYSFGQRWTALRSSRGYSEQAWSDYAEMGWLALRMPEELGGLGAQATAIAPLMEAVGSRLLLEPILASAILGTGLVLKRADAAQRAEMLPRLADGSLRLALAHQESLSADAPTSCECEYRQGALYGSKIAVLHGDCADRFIVSATDRNAGGRLLLSVVDATAPRLSRQSFRLLDGRGAANLSFDGTPARPLAGSGPTAGSSYAADWRAGAESATADTETLAECLREAAVALCSEALGAIRALNAATVRYLKTRQQFGRPLGANQALQHRMVEMYLLEQELRAVSLTAQRALSRSELDSERVISGARAFACQAGRRVAAEAVQMHGGIGISDELDVSHYYRRLMVIGTLFGNRESHLLRFAAASSMLTTDRTVE
jgi:alkylation response protein AidB-like acyl-CoA dehydrogenase